METKYFEYSRNGENEKYSEFTEDEYLKAKEDESRRFISFGNSVLECEKSQYTDYFTQKNHGEYAQKDKNWKKVIPVSDEDIADWDKIRKKFLKLKYKNFIYVDGKDCRKCVWSNTESGKILCTKSCRKKGGRI
jgi:hypothetical protein